MDTRNRTRVFAIVPAGLVALACAITGCTSGDAPEPMASESTSAPSPSATSAPPAEAFAYPDKTDPAQVGIALKYEEGSDPSGEIIAGPAALVADRQFTVEGQCEGDRVEFEVVTADAEKRVLAEGGFTCDDPPAGEFSYRLPYAGVVQVNLMSADDVDRAWVRVVQP
ncbi:hypothetical protein [Microbacterium foliorum]|uniref:hypothetical protein n=1 Tax=Microbacterium foliorum TaxID=104336 RepID=UPI001DD3F72E|nr:hypothetical protein [Microbacterium foliorum]CAH0190875.1 hypothetical protein SRABI03_01735 [Microbacterium foliorum]CAH0225707.1 hypothetical protein SRABI44_02534 [Microbacterium foliorum]